MNRWLAHVALCVICVVALAPRTASAQHVIDRARLGCYTEDLTFITKGANANHLVIIDGLKILGIPAEGKSKKVRQLFDLRDLPVGAGPRGITYVDADKTFVINNYLEVDRLYVLDSKGRHVDTIEIKYLEGYLPVHVEGLTYIPPSASLFPDHFVMGVWDDSGLGRFVVIGRDGYVVDELVPIEGNTCALGVAYLEPDRLMVSGVECDWSTISVIGLDGNILDPVAVQFDGLWGFEGIVQTRSGAIATAGTGGHLYFYDDDFNPMGNRDRVYRENLGIMSPNGVAWMSDIESFVVNHLDYEVPFDEDVRSLLSTVSPSLDDHAELAVLYPRDPPPRLSGAGRLSYLPAEGKTVAGHNLRRHSTIPDAEYSQFMPPSLIFFDSLGNWLDNETVNLEALGLGNPVAVAYMPFFDEYAVTFSSNLATIHFISGDGNEARAPIEFHPELVDGISAIAYFEDDEPGERRLLLRAAERRMLVTDLQGNILDEFDFLDALDIFFATDLATVSTGPYAGSFAVIDSAGGGEIVVFELDN